MTIVKNVMYGHFGDLKSRDRDLVTLKPTKKGNFCLKNILIRLLYNHKIAERGTLKFKHNLGAHRACMRI